MQGVKNKEKVEIIIDRKEGIRKVLNMAKRGDSLVLAGKGHGNYQLKKDRRLHFSDKETVLELLNTSTVGSPPSAVENLGTKT